VTRELTREEQETIVRTNAISKTWEVVTADPKIIRQLERKGWTRDERKNPSGYYSFTIDRLSFPRKEKRKLGSVLAARNRSFSVEAHTEGKKTD